MSDLVVEVYARKDCSSLCKFYSKSAACLLCGEARAIIGKVNREIPFQFKEVHIESSEDLQRRFHEDIPTVFINGKKAFKYKVDEAEFRKQVRKEIIKAGIKRINNKHCR